MDGWKKERRKEKQKETKEMPQLGTSGLYTFYSDRQVTYEVQKYSHSKIFHKSSSDNYSSKIDCV